MSCWERRFPYEKNDAWSQDAAVKRRWYEALEAMGADGVRAHMTNVRGGPLGCIHIGTGRDVTIGFIYDWLTWHERRARCLGNHRHRDRAEMAPLAADVRRWPLAA
jgi:hypothetical protein